MNGQAEAGVNWDKLIYISGENLKAKIMARDSAGTAPARIIWTLYHNGTPVFQGEGPLLNYTGTMPGLYRLQGIAYYRNATQAAFDSTAFVPGANSVRHNLPLPEPEGTAIYLGAVYTQNIAGTGATATTLPYQTASSTEELYLLPGTTHWTFDLDPDTSQADDEVIVRTAKGNWCLNGLAGGLAGENIGYDYGFMPTFIPSPIDYRLKLTADFFKVNGLTSSAFNSRVRIKCWRMASNIYRYERCAHSSFAGGQGRRTRRWAALFTTLNIETDALTRLNRLGTGSAVLTYNTVLDTTSVPLMTLSTSGTPHPVPGHSGLFYTDSNLYAYYEADGQADLAAKVVSAIEGVRPCCISLLTFNSTKPVLSNRIKRVYGNLVLFLLDGVAWEGSYVDLTLHTWKGDVLFRVQINQTYYANEDTTLLRVGHVGVHLSDYQFDETGLVLDVTVNETGATISSVPDPAPTPVTGPDYIYSSSFAPTVNFGGACYVNPVYVPTLDDNAVMVTALGGCHDPVCGPAALYCYTALDAPAENVVVPQPFGFPAPFISFGSHPARCFFDPQSMIAINDTQISLAEYAGSMAVDLYSWSGTNYCGASYGYQSCQAAYAPCPHYGCSIVVVYPVSSSPHPAIEYNGHCFSFSGSVTAYGTRPVISSVDISPVVDCSDPACNQFNASGSVVVYNDKQTFLEVPVTFEHLDYGLAHYGKAAEKIDDWAGGLQEGRRNIVFLRTASMLVYTSNGTGSMLFEFDRLRGAKKELVVDRGGTLTSYDPGLGGTRVSVQLLPHDLVYLRIADPYGRLPLQHRGLRVQVRWHPLPHLPRLFDTVVVDYPGSTAIHALGFCAYTSQGVYSFYGTLPYSGSMSGPVNPDSLVTVTGQDGQEYNLLSVRAWGDANRFALSLPSYSGQALAGPFTFKFYAAREAFGAHGEMDVWFDTDGTFPSYLRAGDFDALALSGTAYRKDSAPTDTNRNSYAVISAAEFGTVSWPNVYVQTTSGQVVTADVTAGSISLESQWFTAPTWPVPVYDPGLSETLIRP